jgi:hypothetical protein
MAAMVSMSRGHGTVQQAILAAFAAQPDNAFLLSELCERVYPGSNRIEKKHRNAVARAAKTIPSIDHMKRGTLGSELVFFDPLNVMSYAMALLKSNFLNGDYQNNDPRKHPDPRQLRWNAMHAGYYAGTITAVEMEIYETTFEIPARLKAQLDVVVCYGITEQDLHAKLAPGGSHHKYIVEGGAWWQDTELRKAQARGDEETAARLQAEMDARFAAIESGINAIIPNPG